MSLYTFNNISIKSVYIFVYKQELTKQNKTIKFLTHERVLQR